MVRYRTLWRRNTPQCAEGAGRTEWRLSPPHRLSAKRTHGQAADQAMRGGRSARTLGARLGLRAAERRCLTRRAAMTPMKFFTLDFASNAASSSSYRPWTTASSVWVRSARAAIMPSSRRGILCVLESTYGNASILLASIPVANYTGTGGGSRTQNAQAAHLAGVSASSGLGVIAFDYGQLQKNSRSPWRSLIRGRRAQANTRGYR